MLRVSRTYVANTDAIRNPHTRVIQASNDDQSFDCFGICLDLNYPAQVRSTPGQGSPNRGRKVGQAPLTDNGDNQPGAKVENVSPTSNNTFVISRRANNQKPPYHED